MNKYFITFAACALAILGASSCQKNGGLQETELPGTHTVNFNASLEESTKTSLHVKIVPAWENTAQEVIHLFENGYVGTNPQCIPDPESKNEKATFSATFPDTEAPFVYKGVIASSDGDNYIVPAVQNPSASSLIDPNADFLIGCETEYQTRPSSIEMKFVRPVAISRLAIYNMEPGNVVAVRINSDDKLTGYASEIDYASGTATFDGGSTTLTMSYGEGSTYSGGIFYAYFISLTGEKKINTVEVFTDEYVYTKTVGKSSTFSTTDFKNIAVDLSEASREDVKDQPLKFMKDEKEITEDSWNINKTGYVSPALEGAVEGAVVSYASSKEDVATVAEDGTVTLVAVGETTISATASAVLGYKETTVSYKLTVTDKDEKYYVKLTGNEIVEGTYLIVASGYALDATHSSSYRMSVSISDNKIKSTSDVDVAAVEITIKDSKYYLKTTKGYSYTSSSSTPIAFASGDADDKYLHTGTIADGVVTFKNKGGRSSEKYYLYYGSSGFSYNTNSTNLSLYLLEGSSKASRNLSFVSSEVKIENTQIGSTYSNTLNGVTTGVKYQSSDPSVATVNEDTGLVNLLSIGETEITASAPETAEYRSGSATYTLKIYDPTAVPKYVLVTSEPTTWEGKYLIVSAASGTAYAFDYSTASTSEPTASGTAVTITEGIIESSTTIDACAVTVTKYGDSHALETDHVAYDITVADGRYLFRYGTNPCVLLQKASKTSDNRQNQHTLTYDNGVRMMFAGNTSTGNKYYFCFNSSSKFTYDGKNAADDSMYRVYFFKLVE